MVFIAIVSLLEVTMISIVITSYYHMVFIAIKLPYYYCFYCHSK